MFTGLILATGQIADIEAASAGDCRMRIAAGKPVLTDAVLGDSIAVNGVCLTVVALGSDCFYADVSRETLSRTTLSSASAGTPVNLETALTPSSRMGGHIVSGHVDGIGRIIDKKPDARSVQFSIEAPGQLAKYIAEKGSICVDGVSLTVNRVSGGVFTVNIVPHTLRETTLGSLTAGTRVNLEVDIIARYLERLLSGEKAAAPAVAVDVLKNGGFAD